MRVLKICAIVLASVVGLFLILGIIGSRTPNKYEFRHAIEQQLNDPDNAVYRNEVIYTQPDGKSYLCGEVSAQNGFGGYTRFTRFVSSHAFAVIEAGPALPVFGYVWSRSCSSFQDGAVPQTKAPP